MSTTSWAHDDVVNSIFPSTGYAGNGEVVSHSYFKDAITKIWLHHFANCDSRSKYMTTWHELKSFNAESQLRPQLKVTFSKLDKWRTRLELKFMLNATRDLYSFTIYCSSPYACTASCMYTAIPLPISMVKAYP